MARKRSTRRSKGEGSYWFDKKNSRHVWYIERDGKRYSVAERDEEKARLRFIELKRQLDRNTDIEGSRQQLQTFLLNYIETQIASVWRETTAHDARKRADLYILPTLGNMRLCDIKHATVAAWVTAMVNQPDENGKFWAFNSIKQALGLLRRALDSAVPDLLEYNPAARMRVPTRRRGDELKIDREAPQQKTFTQEQIISFLAEVQRTNNALYPLYVLAVKLGLRRGELAGLRWKDVDLETRILFVRQQIVRMDAKTSITTPKSESSIRQIPLAIDLVSMLSEHKATIEPGFSEYVFPARNGDYRQPDTLTRHFARTCQRLGFGGFNLHSLRHTAITNWRIEDIQLEVVAALAGHASVNVTANVYSEATIERKRAALEGREEAQ